MPTLTINPTLTADGRDLITALNGVGAVPITHVAVGDTGVAATGDETELDNELERVEAAGTVAPDADSIIIEATLDGDVGYSIRELGFFSNGTLFAYWSSVNETLGAKTANIDYDIVLMISVGDGVAGQLTFERDISVALSTTVQQTVNQAVSAFPIGTRMIFASAPPDGWNIVPAWNDRVLMTTSRSGDVGTTSGSWFISGMYQAGNHRHTALAYTGPVIHDVARSNDRDRISVDHTHVTDYQGNHRHGFDGTWRPANRKVLVCEYVGGN